MIKALSAIGAAALALAASSAAHAFVYPAFGADTGPGLIVTIGSGGALGGVTTGQGPYDGIEDTYIGIVNNSKSTVFSVNLGVGGGPSIGGFDGDGPANATYGQVSTYDPNGYGGPLASFTNNLGSTLTVNFAGGLAPGQTTWFALEEAPTLAQLGVPEPTSWALMMIGIGAVGFAMRRRAAKTLAV